MSARNLRPRELIWRCLDGEASDAEAAELNLLVLSDPEVARELARAARLERTLEIASRMAAEEFRAPPPSPNALPKARAARRATVVAVAAGVAVVTVGFAFSWFSRQPSGSQIDQIGKISKVGKLGGVSPVGTAKSPSAGIAAPAPTASVASAASNGLAAQPSRPAFDIARRVRFADGSIADLRDEGSHIETRVSSMKAMDVVLVQGAARFEVVPLPSRRFRVWVSTSTYVEVIGTVFSVERLAVGVRVSVERGTVKVVSPRNETRVSAGLAEVFAFESPRTHDAPQDRTQDRTQDRIQDRTQDRMKPRLGESEALALGKREASALLTASADARRAHKPEEAAALLQRFLALHSHDPRAAYAAFILGRVLLEELSRPADAAVVFARVEVLDPKTPLVEDALAREVESRSRAGDTSRAQRDARAYLDRYPNGARAEEVRRYSRTK